jgi:uncharacterized membrane protein YoaK (UPF0700 family)
LAAHIVAGNPAICSYVLSVAVFMLVLLLTRLLAGRLEQTGVPAMQPLLLQLLLLVVFFSIYVVAGPYRDTDAILAVIAGMLGVAAMAVQHALVPISLTNSPTTAVITTNVTHFVLARYWLAAIRTRRRKHVTAQCTPSR